MKPKKAKLLERKIVVDYLKALGKEVISIDGYEGICGALIRIGVSEGLRKEIRKLTRDWSHFSGKDNYPIPVPSSLSFPGPSACFKQSTLNGTMWEGEYGELRKDLCLYLSQRLRSREK